MWCVRMCALCPKPPGHHCQGCASQRRDRVSPLRWPFRDVTSYFPPRTHTHTHTHKYIHTHSTSRVVAPGLLWSRWQMELAVIMSSLTPACSVIPCNAQILLCVFVCARVCGVCCVYVHACAKQKKKKKRKGCPCFCPILHRVIGVERK